MELYFLLVLPLLAALISFLPIPLKLKTGTTLLVPLLVFILAIAASAEVFRGNALFLFNKALFLDPLGAYFILLISFISLVSALYSIGYMKKEHEEHIVSKKKLERYYYLFHLFVFTMLLVVVSNNMGILWIALEATTLVSALLVGLYAKEEAIEAAWKYLILCTVGISLGLLGTALTYYSSVKVLGESGDAINWTVLMEIGSRLDPSVIKLAFIFIMVGYGTKVGLAPLHSWLPDAHSEAPSPISAMLSGLLLNCAFYGILRFHMVTEKAVGHGFSSSLLILFGLVSLGLAAFFILVQKNFKRLLAYSSVEHMGIAALGIGIGGFYGLYGAILHLANHSFTKTMMFMVAGNLLQKYHTKEMGAIRGALSSMPVTGPLLLIGVLALTGSPPFSIFISEFLILAQSVLSGQYWITALALILLVIAFAGFMNHAAKMAYGHPPEKMARGEVSRATALPIVILAFFVIAMGLFIPLAFHNIILQVISQFGVKP